MSEHGLAAQSARPPGPILAEVVPLGCAIYPLQDLHQRAHMQASTMFSRDLPDLYPAASGQGAGTSAAAIVSDPPRARDDTGQLAVLQRDCAGCGAVAGSHVDFEAGSAPVHDSVQAQAAAAAIKSPFSLHGHLISSCRAHAPLSVPAVPAAPGTLGRLSRHSRLRRSHSPSLRSPCPSSCGRARTRLRIAPPSISHLTN